jgi:hypothetical protein
MPVSAAVRSIMFPRTITISSHVDIVDVDIVVVVVDVGWDEREK